MKFTIDEKEYTLGSDMFPIADTSNIKVFSSDNTSSFNNDELNRIIDNNEFDVGHCYTNSEKIRLVADHLGLNAEYYTGWLFVSDSAPPIHHAWTVIDGSHVIDMAYSERAMRFAKKVNGFPDWRERFAAETVRRRATIRRSKDCIMGKVLDGMHYVGSIDEMNAAKKRFRDAMAKYPDHVSYRRKGTEPTGASPIQEMVWKMEGKNY